MSGRSEFIANGGHAVCLHTERWDVTLETMQRIERKLDSHNKKLFEGNGHEAIIPAYDKRLSKLESNMLPRDDVRDVVQAFKVGKGILYAVGVVAAIGAAAMLFWHFFQPVKYVVR
jgi:hypothetical protein